MPSRFAAKKAAAAAATAAPSNGATSPMSAIVCTAQQSRFHTATLEGSVTEVDIKDLGISVGDRDLLVNAHLRLKAGRIYALTGRNGTGKTTLLTALAEKLIPGLSPNFRCLLVGQLQDSDRQTKQSTEVEDGASAESKPITVLEHVVRGDEARETAVRHSEALSKAAESTSLLVATRTVRELELEQRRAELQRARLIAMRRSGARGKEARLAEIQAEEREREALEKLAQVDDPSFQPDAEAAKVVQDMLAEVQLSMELLDVSTTEARAASVLSGLGFTQEMIEGPYKALSGGWRARCSLATSLLIRSDVLLLDEISNFLDLETILWLEHFLRDSPPAETVVLISHDQEFLSATVDETIILRGQKLEYFQGTPAAFEIEQRKQARKLQTQKDALDKKREHIEKSIREGIASAKKTGDENRQRMVKSRQKKLDERFGVEQSAKGGRFKLNRDLAGYHLTNRAELEEQFQESRVKIILPEPDKLRTIGDLVHFDAVEFRHPRAKTPLLSDVTFTVEQGGRVAFVGANGQGKSTLAKLIMGDLKPTKGKITRHTSLQIGYFSQHMVEDITAAATATGHEDDEDHPRTALAYFLHHFEHKAGTKVPEQDARAFLGSLGLKGQLASHTPLALLSGGQKVRLALSLITFNPPPLLLLDEPSTHLDAATVQALGRALKNYAGAIILITHDRWFSRVVIEGESAREALRNASGQVDDDDDGEDSTESSDDEVEGRPVHKTYRVGGGGIKLMQKGMQGYVGIVERKLERRKKDP